MIQVNHRFFTLWYRFIVCTFFVTSGCLGPSTSQAPVTQVVTQGSSYPPADASVSTWQVSDYPEPLNHLAPTQDTSYSYSPYPDSFDTAAPVVFNTLGPPPSPGTETSVVIGKLLANGKPATNANLYLAEVIKDGKGVERIASFSRDESPTALVDKEGRFYFADVPPGKYGLILDVAVTAYLLHIPGSEEQLLFVVKAGEEIDLGDLNYDSLPMP